MLGIVLDLTLKHGVFNEFYFHYSLENTPIALWASAYHHPALLARESIRIRGVYCFALDVDGEPSLLRLGKAKELSTPGLAAEGNAGERDYHFDLPLTFGRPVGGRNIPVL